ncbi:WRKY DNA-binding transcription factor 70 [Arachis hypogaea]|uniref:WRKY DNA-binding transcription factor 70 n=1 Tax=Arachis hypogaea TaxID=3818 RepID=UPI000DECEA0E|nr:WRKY DNA-binding transcription factor 70 [Arachis hypogaea]QHN92479.1 putative WRKY transcription factor [Arachis hypogaea]
MKKNTLCSENNDVSWKKKRRIIKELVQGQEAATQLKLLLQNPIGDTSLSAEELLGNVLTSFAETLSLLASNHSQEQPCRHDPSPSSADPSDDYSGESHNMKRSNLTPAKKVGRGCYKRRRTEHTWTTISPTADDNNAWRKYGEKEIQNSKFPRSYFRCSRKYDQNCRAIKHVQRTQENPCMYQITYIGMHSCKATPNDAPTINQDTTPPPPPPPPPSDVVDPSMLSDLKDIIEPYKPSIIMPPNMVSNDNANNIYPCPSSLCSDMDFGVDLVHFRES